MKINTKNLYFNQTLLCNYEKQNTHNKNIHQRNFTNGLTPPPILYRGNYRTCDKNQDFKKNITNHIKDFNNIENTYIPGKGQSIDFLKYIDIDSELKNINRKDTKCINNTYKKTLDVQKQPSIVNIEDRHYRTPIIYNECPKTYLHIGPTRVNHVNENVWNNITNRKNISN